MSTLVIMARYPLVGHVKTRLAERLGVQAACDLYRAFLDDLAARFRHGRRPVVWMYHPPGSDFAALLPRGACCQPQSGADLGERMHNCFRQLGDRQLPLLMIGADVPHIHDDWLDEADQRLADHDLVLGPSADGGYYLIGMKRAHDVFTGVAMGTARVRNQTMELASSQNLRVHTLPGSFDIDQIDDVERLRIHLESAAGAPHLPATAAVLARLR